VDGNLAAIEHIDLARIDVHAQDIVADLRQAGAGDQADIPGTVNRDLHVWNTPRDAIYMLFICFIGFAERLGDLGANLGGCLRTC
jgi:hypothetical protein